MENDQVTGRVRLSSKRTRQIASGHLWVYAADVQDVAGDPAPGDVVDLYTDRSQFFGRGFYNPHSKIRVRILTFRDQPVDEAFWASRIAAACALRDRVVSHTSAYRLVHGE